MLRTGREEYQQEVIGRSDLTARLLSNRTQSSQDFLLGMGQKSLGASFDPTAGYVLEAVSLTPSRRLVHVHSMQKIETAENWTR
jgi:hypothetical protein